MAPAESPDSVRDRIAYDISDAIGRCAKHAGGAVAWRWLGGFSFSFPVADLAANDGDRDGAGAGEERDAEDDHHDDDDEQDNDDDADAGANSDLDVASFSASMATLSRSAHALSRRSAIFILGDSIDCAQTAPAAMISRFGRVLPLIEAGCRDASNAEIRQAAVFGLGVATHTLTHAQLDPYLARCVAALDAALTHPCMHAPGHEDCASCVDNTLATAVKFAFRHGAGPRRDEVQYAPVNACIICTVARLEFALSEANQ
jgi:hypothetical protein